MIYISYILCIIVLALLLWISYYSWKYRSIRHIPGPTPYPIIGNFLEFTDYTNILKILMNFIKKYGNIVQMQGNPNERFLLVSDIELIEVILRSPKYISKSDIYHILDPWLGKGLLQTNGPVWQTQRKMSTPAFHFNILEDYIAPFDSACEILIDIFSKYNEKELIDVMPIITAFTLDIIAETAMGAKINAQLDPHSEYAEALDFITNLIVIRTLSVWKRYDFLFQFSNDFKKQTKALKILDELTYKFIEERKKTLINEKSQGIEDSTDKNKKRLLLDILINLPTENGVLSNEEIKDFVATFTFGGHDTTASAISFILYALANNPVVQEKVVEELKLIYGTDISRPVTMQDVQSMKYTDLVIKEALRLFTPVPLFGRKLTECVNYNGTILPKDLQIWIFTHSIHRNPDIYENPDIFNPERFSTNTIKPYTFLPFSAGPRNCIGQKYAMIELKVTVAKLLRRFEFVSAGPEYNVKLYPQIVMKTTNGVHLKIKKRDF